jgi:hypothetical protein
MDSTLSIFLLLECVVNLVTACLCFCLDFIYFTNFTRSFNLFGAQDSYVQFRCREDKKYFSASYKIPQTGPFCLFANQILDTNGLLAIRYFQRFVIFFL